MRHLSCVHQLLLALLGLALIIGFATPVGATTILLDFGNDDSFGGISVPNPDSNGNYWTSVWNGAFYPNLVDIGNNPTSINFGFDGSLVGGTDSFNGPAGPTTQVPGPTPTEVAATDIDAVALGLLGGSKEAAIDFYTSSRFQIQGLNPAKTYDLSFFGSHKFSTDDSTVYTVYSDPGFSIPVGSASLDHQTPGSPWLHNRDTVATVSGLSPGVSNILYVEFGGAGGNSGYLNSLQIVEIPEPFSFVMLASGFGSMLICRRR